MIPEALLSLNKAASPEKAKQGGNRGGSISDSYLVLDSLRKVNIRIVGR